MPPAGEEYKLLSEAMPSVNIKRTRITREEIPAALCRLEGVSTLCL
jgi:hypothetical protein